MPILDRPGASLWYEEIDLTLPWVEAPETVLFHHGVGIDHRIWCRWLPALCSDYRIVLMDMRGCGQSRPVPENIPDWTLDTLADDVLAVINATGAERIHYVGESLGGALGYHLAIHHRHLLRSLTACTAPHRGSAVRGLPDWRQVIDSEGMAVWSENMMARRFRAGILDTPEWDWFHNIQQRCDPATVLAQANLLTETDLTEELGSITTPTLMIGGDSSPFLPAAVLVDTFERVPGAQLHLVNGARHGVVLSHGTAAAQAMRKFIRSL